MEFLHGRHVKYLKFCMDVIPGAYVSLDSSRMTLLFYAVSGLDLLDKLEVIKDRAEIVEWIYDQQITAEDSDGGGVARRAGFRGAPACRTPAPPLNGWDCGHITMTYTALASLLVLGDELARVDRAAVIEGVRALQLPDGSFLSSLYGGESDMRFVYCAAAVCHILDDWSGMDRPLTRQYILDSMRYDYGISQGPLLESHGGSTFCALATLSLMGDDIAEVLGQKKTAGLVHWCLTRQGAGFCGRPNKDEDSCYTFWIGASLRLLGVDHLVSEHPLREFVYSTQDPITGGLAKWPGHGADPLHTYLGISGLALSAHPALKRVHPALNISVDAAARLARVHERWRATSSAPNQPAANQRLQT